MVNQKCSKIIAERTKLLYYLLDDQQSNFVTEYVPKVIQDVIIHEMLGYQKIE